MRPRLPGPVAVPLPVPLPLALAAFFLLAISSIAPSPSRAACQIGDPCTGSICSAGCLSFFCNGGTWGPGPPLQEGAPCQNVPVGPCESCTCGDLGQQNYSDRPAGTTCGPGDLCTTDVCDGAGTCTDAPRPAGTVCGPTEACSSSACDGAGVCVGDTEPAGTPCGGSGETCDGAGVCQAPEIGGALNPGRLLVYYGIPSLINGAGGDLDVAAAELGRYDVVVLGAGLEVPPGEPGASPEHANTVAIVGHPALASTTVFGYVDLGVRDTVAPLSDFTIGEIVQRSTWWLELVGVDGIFLDDYGYDFCVSRDRQNAAITGIRAIDPGRTIPVVANAFRPDDVFGVETAHAFATPWCDDGSTFVANPAQTPPVIGSDDFYLYESHQVINGEFEANDYAFDWQFKSQYLAAAQATFGSGILSVTTIDGSDPYDEDQFHYSWYSAALYGHVATGWGEVLFSAPTSLAPDRAPPVVDLGDVFTSAPTQSVDFVEWTRQTDAGEIAINTQSKTYGFAPEPSAALQMTSGLAVLVALARRRAASAGRLGRRRPDGAPPGQSQRVERGRPPGPL